MNKNKKPKLMVWIILTLYFAIVTAVSAYFMDTHNTISLVIFAGVITIFLAIYVIVKIRK